MKKRITSVILALAMVLALMPMSITATDFSDVRSSDYYAEAAENLAEKDILAGYPDGTFGAGRLITRAEMATIICRMLDKESEALKSAGKTDFDDVSADHWASGYINVASDEGIVNGDGDGKFRPGDNVKHEEAIKMVVCALGLDDDIDIDPDDWSAGYLQKADEMGISDNLKGSKGNAATRGDVAVMVYSGLQSDDEVPADDEEPTDIEVSADIEAPTASLKAGTYTGLRDVTLKTATKGADIYYTTDGTTPTTGSTKYTKAISISDTCTLKAIAVKNGAASSDIMSVDYTIKKNTGGGGSSSAPVPTPEQGKFKVSFDLNYEGAMGAPELQIVEDGEKAVEPAAPSREGYSFIGWATTTSGETMFNFNTRITANTTLFAKWAIQNGNNPVSLDDPEPDIEIYSFETDTYDILIGESETVTFTAEIFANIVLSNTDVAVVDETGTVLGYMNDDGIDGDIIPNDGTYTLCKEFIADTIRNMQYKVNVKDITSNDVNIGYYRKYTEQDFNIASDVASKLREVSQPFINADYTVDVEKVEELMNAISLCLDEQKNSGIVAEYNVNFNTVRIVLSEGYLFNYSVEVAGVSAGGTQVYVASFAPFDSIRRNPEEEALYDSALDGTAENIGNTFEKYAFNGNYNLNEVTLDSLKHISDYEVVIWGGHGGYDSSVNGYGSSLMTGQLVDSNTSIEYSNDISSERILDNFVASGRNTYCVTGGFFEKYLGNMDNALVYLSACHSGQDMIDGIRHKYQLAQSFIDKGAKAVVGNSESILSIYTYEMERDILNRMCVKSADEYYTLSEALDYAKSVNGQDDGTSRRARPVIFPINNTGAAKYCFENDETGFISGTVKDAQNGNIISNALVRVYQDGNLVKRVRTDNSGYYKMELPAGEYIVKITAGSYKTAKMGVTVVENNTTYCETMLLVSVGINSGYANGTITNALTGMAVSDVTLKVRRSWGNIYGNILLTTQTNENGYYEITYTPGVYTIEYSKEGFITGYKNIIVGVIDFAAQHARISPLLGEGAYIIYLDWDNVPYDLDSHLTGPIENSTERFHLYYPMANLNGGHSNVDKYTLDWDNTDIVANPDKGETTTIIQQLDGVYRFSVHDFSNGGNAASTQMANSNATVVVWKGNSDIPVATFHVPTTEAGTIWTVFELSGDVITPINRISNGLSGDISLFSLEEDVCSIFNIYDETTIIESIIEK